MHKILTMYQTSGQTAARLCAVETEGRNLLEVVSCKHKVLHAIQTHQITQTGFLCSNMDLSSLLNVGKHRRPDKEAQ